MPRDLLGKSGSIFARHPQSFSEWLQLAKVLGDVADGLAQLSDPVDKVTVRTVHRIDWFKGRPVRDGLIDLSRRLSALLADQQRSMASLIDTAICDVRAVAALDAPSSRRCTRSAE